MDTERQLAEGYRELYAPLALKRAWRADRIWIIFSSAIMIWGLTLGLWLPALCYFGFAFFVFSARFYREAFYVATEVAAHAEMQRRGLVPTGDGGLRPARRDE